MADFELKVNGRTFSGFKDITATLGIQCGDSFNLRVTDKWGAAAELREIKNGMKCTVLLGGQVVITGRVDDSQPGYSADAHDIVISARDATGDLVDCAALHKTGEWHGSKLDAIAKDLCAPFGIKVTVSAGVNLGAPFNLWKIEPGETAFECLDRACRYRGVVLMADGIGGLQLTQAGAGGGAAGELRSGENILLCEPRFSWKERFSDYYVQGQGAGSDEAWGADVAQMQGHAVDQELKDAGIYRPTVMIADDQGTVSSLQTRAENQRTTSAAKSQAITYTVQGWDVAGKIWRPNTKVHVVDKKLPLDVTWLITEAEYSRKEEAGTLTRLTVMPKEAYTAAAIPQPEQW